MTTKMDKSSEESPDHQAVGVTTDADVADITDSIVDSMPDVQEHAIEQHAEKTEKIAEYTDGLKDADGQSFDPRLHVTDESGLPKLTKTGKLRKRRQPQETAPTTRKPVTSFVATPKSEHSTHDEPVDTSAASAAANSRAAGVATANLLITVGMSLGGEEWAPVKNTELGIDEKALLENAFADYYLATGKTDLPPGLALTVAVGSYALPRFSKPKTKTRLKILGVWLKQKWENWKNRKQAKTVKKEGRE